MFQDKKAERNQINASKGVSCLPKLVLNIKLEYNACRVSISIQGFTGRDCKGTQLRAWAGMRGLDGIKATVGSNAAGMDIPL